MAQIQIITPDNVHRSPNTGDATEFGTPYATVLTSLQTMFTEIYAGIQNPAGTAVRVAGNISAQLTPIGSNASGTLSQTLVTYALAPNTFKNVGNMIEVTAWGTYGATANTKSVALNIGGVTFSTGSGTGSGSAWSLYAEVGKYAANAQTEYYAALTGNVVVAPKSSTDTSVDTSTININLVISASAQSDVVVYGFQVEYFS